MKKALFALGLVTALAAFAQTTKIVGITLFPSTRFEFLNCAVEGSTAQTVTEGTYLLRVTDEDLHICMAAASQTDGGKGAGCQTPDGGTVETGDKFPTGMAMMLSIPAGGKSVTCRSTLATGDLLLTRATQ